MDLGVKGLKAIILGGSRGIGRYTADLLAREGASVAICGRDESSLKAAEKELSALGGGKVFAKAANL
ncbi:MAG: SDR family NAD(P)-dependent oxidoreductase, partial [Alphaproteobacteria bacterium]|nr:SDR family NAD(P)-dependent oxidoreductase [Alphaproteobacteria bacterium]